MANEIAITASLSYTKGGASDSLSVTGLADTLVGTRAIHHVQSVATNPGEALDPGEASVGGWLIIKNLDADNFVTLEVGEATSFCQLNPGEVALFRATAAVTAVADTAACLVEYLLLEA